VTRDVDFPEAVALLRRADRLVLTTHVKPDGDALGSMAALARWLAGMGKQVLPVVPTPPPAKYAFLDPDRRIRVAGRDVDPASVPLADLVCVVDTGTWLQLAGVEPLLRQGGAPVLVIDHHRTSDALADHRLVDPDAAATAVLIHRLLVEAGATIDAETATGLFVGLVLDTDWFRLPSVRPETLRLAADLVEAGVCPHLLHERLHLNEELPRVLLAGRAIQTLTPALGGRATVMRLAQSLFRELGADVGDTENLINECMRVRGTQVGLMVVEAGGGEVRVSLRSKPPVSVLPVAERFGGGGHHRAAGFRARGTLDEVTARTLAAVRDVLDAGPGRASSDASGVDSRPAGG